MKKIIIIIVLYIFFKIFINYQNILLDINNITLIFIKNIFPSLFLFFIISSLLSNYGFIDLISNSVGKIISKLFNVSPVSSYVIIMSMFSGFPSSAKYIKELLDSKKINNLEAEKVLLSSHFANPLFILSIIPEYSLLIIICHFITNFILAFIFRNFNGKFNNNLKIKNVSISFSKLLNKSIEDIMHISLNLLGIIVFFYVLSNLLNIKILTYFLEMTSSITILLKENINLKYKYALITGILSFGGISVHMQVFNILEKEKIRYKPYLISRLLHMIISILLFLLLY